MICALSCRWFSKYKKKFRLGFVLFSGMNERSSSSYFKTSTKFQICACTFRSYRWNVVRKKACAVLRITPSRSLILLAKSTSNLWARIMWLLESLRIFVSNRRFLKYISQFLLYTKTKQPYGVSKSLLECVLLLASSVFMSRDCKAMSFSLIAF